jgi:hypothetical protein
MCFDIEDISASSQSLASIRSTVGNEKLLLTIEKRKLR